MQQVVSPMTAHKVRTVIGYITNAILTFEPLQIRSNLSGGPQFFAVEDAKNAKCVFSGDAKTNFINLFINKQ